MDNLNLRNGNGAGATNAHAAINRDALTTVILLNNGHGVNGLQRGAGRQRYYHRPEIVRCRIPKPHNRSGYGYEYRWACECGAKARRTWRYNEIRWPARFVFSMVTPPRWQSERLDHTSARESARDHVRNATRGPNRGKKSHRLSCAFYCGGSPATRDVEGVPACDRCATEVQS